MKNEGEFYYLFYSLASLCYAPLIAALLFLLWKLVLWSRTQVWPHGGEDHHLLDPLKVHYHYKGSQGAVPRGPEPEDHTQPWQWEPASDKEEGILKY